MVDASPARRLRWYQFGLRSLILAMTALIFVLVGWRIYIAPHVASYRRQQQTIELIKKLGGSYQATPAPDWLRRLTGEDFQDVELVDLADCDEPDAYIEQVAALLKLEMLAVGGEKFRDEHLERLREMTTLQGLVLDSTDITAETLDSLRRRLPNLDVHLSPRRMVAVTPPLKDIQLYAAQGSGSHEEVRRRLGDRFFGNYPAGIMMGVLSRDDERLPRLWQLNGQLFELTLSGPGANNESLVHLRRLTSLSRLGLEGTRVTDDGLRELQALANLKELSLGQTPITDAGLAELTVFRKLERLHLHGTQVSGPGLAHLAGATQLKSLDLTRTKVDDAGLGHVENLRNLTSLDLSRTQMGDAGLVHLKGLILLRDLRLDKTRVSDQGLAHLKDLRELSILSLAGTMLKGDGLGDIAKLPKLRYLSLNATSVTDAALSHLEMATALQTLELQATEVTAAGVAKLQKALPKCKLRWNGAN